MQNYGQLVITVEGVLPLKERNAKSRVSPTDIRNRVPSKKVEVLDSEIRDEDSSQAEEKTSVWRETEERYAGLLKK